MMHVEGFDLVSALILGDADDELVEIRRLTLYLYKQKSISFLSQ